MSSLKRHKPLLPCVFAGLALTVLCPAGRSDDGRGTLEAPAQKTAGARLDPAEHWKATAPKLVRSLHESRDAITRRIAQVDEFFAQRKQGARPFAETVLSLDGKARAAAAAAEFAVGGLAELFGEKPRTGPDSFTIFVRTCFTNKVLDPAQVTKQVEAALAGYAGDAAEIEGRLLIDLKADIDDKAVDLRLEFPALRGALPVGAGFDAVIGETVNAASTDLFVSLSMFVASNVISDQLTAGVLPDDTSKAGKALANLIAGFAVDKVMEEVAKGAGYDPVKDVSARTAAGIDRIRNLVVEGDPDAVKCYRNLYVYREGHPDLTVRNACGRAMSALARSANLGLRVRLEMEHDERYRQRLMALAAYIFGPDPAREPYLLLQPLDAAKCPASATLIGWANSVTAAFGVTH